jgi:hypothetical protein
MTSSQQILEEGLKEFDKECEVRWTEHGNFPVVCGHPFPCPQHTSREETKSFITTLYNRGVEAGRNEAVDYIKKSLGDLYSMPGDFRADFESICDAARINNTKN